jgi:hypothetical protein
MALIPHYVQIGGAPAVKGAGFGLFGCACGQSLLISGYEARNFLAIAVRCGVCGRVTETPGLPAGARPPPAVTLVERGMENPPASVTSDTVLISREEVERLAALYQPRKTLNDVHVISDALLDDVEFQQRRWTEVPLDPTPKGYLDQPLAWAVAHFRARLRDPDWTSFTSDSDMAAVVVIAAFRDLFGAWVHHPLFGTMVWTAGLSGFSLHAMSMFGVAKALMLGKNRVSFQVTEGARPRIESLRMMVTGQEDMAIALNPLERFEWPNAAVADPRTVRSSVIEAMASIQGRINRLRPGILVLSIGIVRPTFDQVLIESLNETMVSHGKRHRGLAAVAGILPKVAPTGKPREVRFGYSFYPVPNRNHSVGDPVIIGTREDYPGLA